METMFVFVFLFTCCTSAHIYNLSVVVECFPNQKLATKAILVLEKDKGTRMDLDANLVCAHQHEISIPRGTKNFKKSFIISVDYCKPDPPPLCMDKKTFAKIYADFNDIDENIDENTNESIGKIPNTIVMFILVLFLVFLIFKCCCVQNKHPMYTSKKDDDGPDYRVRDTNGES